MNTPALETERLILRKFTSDDLEALYQIYSDEEANRFLPWFPLKSITEAQAFYEERYAAVYDQPQGYAYAVCLKKDGIPYITATHDRNNPRSGGVMRNVGMKYQYSYEEQWQPKNILVTFRMYQLNLDGNRRRVYKKYWNISKVHFVETGL